MSVSVCVYMRANHAHARRRAKHTDRCRGLVEQNRVYNPISQPPPPPQTHTLSLGRSLALSNAHKRTSHSHTDSCCGLVEQNRISDQGTCLSRDTPFLAIPRDRAGGRNSNEDGQSVRDGYATSARRDRREGRGKPGGGGSGGGGLGRGRC